MGLPHIFKKNNIKREHGGNCLTKYNLVSIVLIHVCGSDIKLVVMCGQINEGLLQKRKPFQIKSVFRQTS